jgi:LAGLIDADG endonuclease
MVLLKKASNWNAKAIKFLISRIGSSETTRGAPYNLKKSKKFVSFVNLIDLKKAPFNLGFKVDPHFLEWFIGLTEGDGCFYIRDDEGRLRLGWQVSQKDPKVLYLMQKTLGFGSVSCFQRLAPSEKKELESNEKQELESNNVAAEDFVDLLSNNPDGLYDRYWTYSVSSKEDLLKMAWIFNGNIVLPKRRVQFNKWVKIGQHLKIIPLIFKNKHEKNILGSPKPSLESAWLSGFFDSEGCFYATLSQSSANPGERPSFKQKAHLTQKNDYGENDILRDIGKLFQTKAKVRQVSNKSKSQIAALSKNTNSVQTVANKTVARAKKKEKLTQKIENIISNSLNPYVSSSKSDGGYYRLEICCLITAEKIISYLSRFKLKTSKYIAFRRWSRVFLLRDQGYHLIEENIPKLIKLTKAINRYSKLFAAEKSRKGEFIKSAYFFEN